MSIQLLDKTRKINKLLHNNDSNIFLFNDICKVLSEILFSNVLVISKSGKILGLADDENVVAVEEYLGKEVGGYIDHQLNERLLGILSTKENFNLITLGFSEDISNQYWAIIVPIDISGERLGTLFIYRTNKQYDIDDIILSEYGDAVVGLEMIRSVCDEQEDDERKKQIVEGAIHSLSNSEKKAIKCVMDEINDDECVIVASKIAKNNDITRSVIVNAIRKFESAGIIETHSNGMKGTYIKIVNNYVFDTLQQLTD